MNNNGIEKNTNQYDVILLITEKNLSVLEKSITYIKSNLGADAIYGIAASGIESAIRKLGIDFIDENEVMPGLTYDTIKSAIAARGLDVKRTGWYFQQFIKYAYAYRTRHIYYLTWDADTIPLRPINYFEQNKPLFIEKKEYHKGYFNTMNRLFDGKVYRVNEDISYIAENMIFNRDVVKEIITEIEENKSIKGKLFFEKILASVSKEDFMSGFSEFETYGNFVRLNHKEMYGSLRLRTLRNASFFIGQQPTKEQFEWAKQDYDIVSIEGKEFFISTLSKNRIFRQCFQLKFIAQGVLHVRSIRRRILGLEQLDYD